MLRFTWCLVDLILHPPTWYEGVESDADERTLKAAYMQLMRQYHPDKWRADSEHGMARDEAHDRFHQIKKAYEHLMYRFEDDRDSDDESQ